MKTSTLKESPRPLAASDEGGASRLSISTEPTSVLVTGVGGIVGQGVYKCLARGPYRLVGADASEWATGLYAAHSGYRIPRVSDPYYVNRLLEICRAENVRFLFPGLDMELPVLARSAERFRDAGVTVIVSDPLVIEVGDDKLKTAKFLEAHNFPAPRTLEASEHAGKELGFPLVLKPRTGGSRSCGVCVVENGEALRLRLNSVDVDNYVAQEFIEGDEITCGSINFDGVCYGVLTMRRTLRDGDTHKAFVTRDPEIESFVRSVAEQLKPFGPCNFQLRMRYGTPYIFEINPRCSGGGSIRALAGFNEPRMTLDYLQHGILPSFAIEPIAVFRYQTELVVENSMIEEMSKTGTIHGVGKKL